ncbi:MAG: LPXTG cell wall anchor domain-containing protein, partial [Coriobacteriia bacterium]|nr:LPXTG cell wall anchor domain-containing protein [Coriobacteriia bacterium]
NGDTYEVSAVLSVLSKDDNNTKLEPSGSNYQRPTGGSTGYYEVTKVPTKEKLPKTGDSSYAPLYLGLFSLAATIVYFTLSFRKKSQR